MYKGADLTFCTYLEDGTSRELLQENETFYVAVSVSSFKLFLLPETKEFAIFTVGALIMRHSKNNFFV